MAFHEYGKVVSFPRNDHVDIHVRAVTLTAGEKTANMVEIREFIKNGEMYGHGLVIPVNEISDLKIALDRVVPTQ